MLASGVSYADFVVAEFSLTSFSLAPELKATYPKSATFMEKIFALPQIAAYVKQRPQTPL